MVRGRRCGRGVCWVYCAFWVFGVGSFYRSNRRGPRVGQWAVDRARNKSLKVLLHALGHQACEIARSSDFWERDVWSKTCEVVESKDMTGVAMFAARAFMVVSVWSPVTLLTSSLTARSVNFFVLVYRNTFGI